MPTAAERALRIIAERGGTVRTRDPLSSDIHPPTLYALRDDGSLQRLARGVYRLASLPPLGDPEERFERASALDPTFALALGHVGLDDWDVAFHWWNQAVEVRDPIIVPIKTFPFFDPVRDEPRYRAILRRMNLSEDRA